MECGFSHTVPTQKDGPTARTAKHVGQGGRGYNGNAALPDTPTSWRRTQLSSIGLIESLDLSGSRRIQVIDEIDLLAYWDGWTSAQRSPLSGSKLTTFNLMFGRGSHQAMLRVLACVLTAPATMTCSSLLERSRAKFRCFTRSLKPWLFLP